MCATDLQYLRRYHNISRINEMTQLALVTIEFNNSGHTGSMTVNSTGGRPFQGETSINKGSINRERHPLTKEDVH